MNSKQKKTLETISNINYTDIDIGKDFQSWLKTCEFIHNGNKEIKEDKEKNTYLLSSFKIIFKEIKEAENVGYKIKNDFDRNSPNFVQVLTNEYLEVLIKRLCEGLLNFYKFVIVRNLLVNKFFSRLIIQFYLDGTDIGGVEKRGWDSKEVDSIVKFMTENIDIIQEYASDVIFLGTDGKVLIQEYKGLDNLGEQIHSSYTNNMMKQKEEREERRYQEKQMELKIKKGVKNFINETKEDDYSNIPPLSRMGNSCEDNCKKAVWPGYWNDQKTCACNVRKNGWLGSYLEPEKCDPKRC